MSRAEIREAFAQIVADVVGVDPEEVTEEKVLVDELDVDSLSMVEVVVVIGDRLGVTIPDEAVADLRTVGDVVSYIDNARVPA